MPSVKVFCPFAAAWALATASLLGQSPSPAATPAAPPSPTPVTSALVVATTEKDAGLLDEIEAALATDRTTANAKIHTAEIEGRIATQEAEAERRARSDGRVVSLQADQSGWTALGDEIANEKRVLAAALTRLDERRQNVDQIAARWRATRQSPEGKTMPPDVLRRLDALQARVGVAGKRLDDQRKTILTLQSRLAEDDTRIGRVLAAAQQARNAALDRLFVPDSPPMWEPKLYARPSAGGTAAGRAELDAQGRTLRDYLAQERGPIALQIAIWIGFVAAFRWAGRRTQAWVEVEPKLRHSTRIFEVPLAAATLVALACTPLLHPSAPRPVLTFTGALLLVPLLIVVRRLIERSFRPLTWALALFYLAGLVRQATAAVPFVPRLVFLAEMAGAALFCLWLVKISLFSEVPARAPVRWRAVRAGAFLGVAAFALAAAANVFGYFNLSVFVGRAMLVAAYLAVLLYVATRIAEGLVIFALNVPPASLLGMVRHHRALLERRCARGLRWAGFFAWVALSLDQLSLWRPFLGATGKLLDETLKVGPVSAASVLAFGLAVWASFLVSRFVRFALEEDVYRRVSLARGASFAFSTLLHYSILFVGFYLALTILIGDMTRLTILAGAFTVGIGFGLQNVVNNFVSGIIVLFERPVKIGDVVQIGTDVGEVRRIGVRATVIQTPDGAEIIVPNAKLISDPVTNWTLYDRQRAIQVELATADTVDPNRVIALLEEAALAHEAVSRKPAPRAELSRVAGGQFTFELHAWTDDIDGWRRLRSDLTIAVSALLPRHGIEIA